jgi:hypothetical protein
MPGIDDYSELEGFGLDIPETKPTAPEDEVFHSVYIAGRKRTNEMNIVEEIGKLQIRGVQNNLTELYFVITHVKDIYAKIIRNQRNQESIECFSYKEGQFPWYGTTKLADGSPRMCPPSAKEREGTNFCEPCRTHIIVAGVLVKDNGSPIAKDDGKPVMVFLRGKGMKFNNISEYLAEMRNLELDPIFEPVTDRSKDFEKRVVNNSRFITKVTVGEAESTHGNMVKVFELEKTQALPKPAVLKVLELSKNMAPAFREKMDWSVKKKSTKGYDGKPENEELKNFGAEEGGEPAPTQPTAENVFSFDKIKF